MLLFCWLFIPSNKILLVIIFFNSIFSFLVLGISISSNFNISFFGWVNPFITSSLVNWSSKGFLGCSSLGLIKKFVFDSIK